MSAREEQGFTLVELLIGMVLSLVLITAAMSMLTVFLRENARDTLRTDAQANARTMIDRLSREVRNAASPVNNSSPNAVTAGLLERATSDDIAFESVSAAGLPPTGDVTNETQVRYCLGANNTLWRQSTTPSSTFTNLPGTSACPSTDSAWQTTSSGGPCCIELTDVTNEIGGDTSRPLFTFGPANWTSTAQIKQIDVDMYVDENPGGQPGATELTSAVYLRNDTSAPLASFPPPTQTTVLPGVTDLQLDASSSSDPNGQALTYQWYTSGACPAPSGAVLSSSQQADAGHYTSGTSQTFLLVVTDTAGLNNCTSRTVTVQ